MLDLKYIKNHSDEIQKNLINRNVKLDWNDFIKTDKQRIELQKKIDALKAEQHKANEEIVKLNKNDKQEKIGQMRAISGEIKNLEEEFKSINDKFIYSLEQIPNITHPDAPIGSSDKDNKEIEVVGKIPKQNFSYLDHVALGKKLDILDFEAGTKITGNKFYFLKREGALLELALINYAINTLVKKGFIPIITPDMATKEILKASGFNPRDDSDQIYNINNTSLSLIATAEITIGGYHASETLSDKKLPIKYVGLSHCFRKEAGTYGQESKGLYRVHQFTKIEMYIICLPENSDKLHQELLETEKELFTGLEIPFRVVDVCTGDLGGPAYRKYDLEAWMPMKKNYGEVTSTSNCTDFQARRLNIRFVDKQGKKQFVHTLNGTAIAVSRALIAILENNQQKDGSVIIPKVLRPYMNNLEAIHSRK
jgi:seryl-tRNA synthetase